MMTKIPNWLTKFICFCFYATTEKVTLPLKRQAAISPPPGPAVKDFLTELPFRFRGCENGGLVNTARGLCDSLTHSPVGVTNSPPLPSPPPPPHPSCLIPFFPVPYWQWQKTVLWKALWVLQPLHYHLWPPRLGIVGTEINLRQQIERNSDTVNETIGFSDLISYISVWSDSHCSVTGHEILKYLHPWVWWWC